MLPGGIVVTQDAHNNPITVLQNYGGNSTLQIVAGNTIRVGSQLQAGQSINLTAGTPGSNPNDNGLSITFLGRHYEDGKLLAFARAYQEATGFHHSHPPGF